MDVKSEDVKSDVKSATDGYRFAGIEHAERLGYGVEQDAAHLHRLAFVERQCMMVAAGRLLSTPEWEVKILLGRHLYEDAEHHTTLRVRISELRRSERSVDHVPDPALDTLMDQAIRAESTIELLTGLYRVIKPALVAAYKEHKQRINPLVDYPTDRALSLILVEEEAHITLGQQYLHALLTKEEDKQTAAAWEAHLRAYLSAAGGMSGDEQRLTAKDLPAPRGDGQPWQMDRVSGRDERFSVSQPKDPCVHVPEYGDRAREGLEQMMWVRFHEMSPAEAVGAFIVLEKDRPWEFYRDLARHCWDEVRHSAFGQAALQAEGIDPASNPNWTGWAEMALSAFTPMEAYTHLTVAIEQAGMKYPPGKRQEYEFCRDTARHSLMALYQDYDWADEVNHAQFGQRWVVKEIFQGDRRAAIAAGKETMQRRAQYFARFAVNGQIPDSYSRRVAADKASAPGY
jgi:uncharacterized ferritin-like protein (DUF455 family)